MRLFLPKLGLGTGNPPSGRAEAREVMVGNHPPSESVETELHPALHKEYLHKLMGGFLEELHRSVRSIALQDTYGLSPIFSAVVSLCNYQLRQWLELSTNEVLSATAESCTGEYRQQSSSALPCTAAELFPQRHYGHWEEIIGQVLKLFHSGLARALQLWTV